MLWSIPSLHGLNTSRNIYPVHPRRKGLKPLGRLMVAAHCGEQIQLTRGPMHCQWMSTSLQRVASLEKLLQVTVPTDLFQMMSVTASCLKLGLRVKLPFEVGFESATNITGPVCGWSHKTEQIAPALAKGTPKMVVRYAVAFPLCLHVHPQHMNGSWRQIPDR